jgi:hypothetical protein
MTFSIDTRHYDILAFSIGTWLLDIKYLTFSIMTLSLMSLGILHSAWHFDIQHGIMIFSIMSLYIKNSA